MSRKSAVFAVCPLWMNHFLSLFSDKMGNKVAVTLSFVLHISPEGQEERAVLELGSLVCAMGWGAAPAPLSSHQISK